MTTKNKLSVPRKKKMIYPCKCTDYNGGQCYNCLNGAHHLCAVGCKIKTKGVGLRMVFKKKVKLLKGWAYFDHVGGWCFLKREQVRTVKHCGFKVRKATLHITL